MATYKQIQDWVKQHFGFVPKTCWIAHVKSLSGLPMRKAHNRIWDDWVAPCPPGKRGAIRAALVHYKMLKE